MPITFNRIKAFLKRSRTFHRLYKLAMMLPQAPIASFADPIRLRSIIKVLPDTMLSLPRLMNAYDCVRVLEREKIAGGIVECGVWSGGCVGLMALVNRRFGSDDRVFHLFDSFEGLHQPSTDDVDVLASFQAAHPEVDLDNGGDSNKLVAIGASVGASREQVENLLFEKLQIDRTQVVFHCGWFQDTVPLARESIGPLALLRLDGDLYESTKVCLDHLYDCVVEGGFIIIDDYGTFEGCRRAVSDFLAGRSLEPELTRIDSTGVYFRKSEPACAGRITPRRENALAAV